MRPFWWSNLSVSFCVQKGSEKNTAGKERNKVIKIEINCWGWFYEGAIPNISLPTGEGDWVWRIKPSPSKAFDKVVIHEEDTQGWGHSFGIYFLKDEETITCLHIGEGGNPDARATLAKIIGDELAKLWLGTDMSKLRTLNEGGSWVTLE